MAAPGIELNPQIPLSCFEPTVEQYVKKIQQAVASENKTAAEQALAKLEKAVGGSGPMSERTGTGASGQVITGLQYVRAALEENDFSSAGQAISALRKDLADSGGGGSGADGREATVSASSAPDGQSDGQQSEEESSGNVDVSV